MGDLNRRIRTIKYIQMGILGVKNTSNEKFTRRRFNKNEDRLMNSNPIWKTGKFLRNE